MERSREKTIVETRRPVEQRYVFDSGTCGGATLSRGSLSPPPVRVPGLLRGEPDKA